MKKTLSVLALIVCGLWSASLATATPSYCDGIAANMVTNCGFETGDFTGWTVGGTTANPGSNYYGVDAFDLSTGNFGAYMSQDFLVSTSPVTLSQTLTTVSGTNYIVSFFLEQDTAPTLGYNHAFSAAWGATTLLSLAPTVALPGTVGAFTQYSYTIAATGASTVLNFNFRNDDNYWSFDDVSVTAVTATPEPSTLMLAGLALGGLLVARRRIAG